MFSQRFAACIFIHTQFVIFCVTEEPPVMIDWRSKVNQGLLPKHWMPYVLKSAEQMLSDFPKQGIGLAVTLRATSLLSSRLVKLFSAETVANVSGKTDHTQEEKALAVSTFIFWACYKWHCHRKYWDRILSVDFKLHKLLRLNVTFNHMNVRKQHELCNPHNVTVSAKERNFLSVFVFCGVYFNFILYPMTRNVTFSTTLAFRHKTIVHLTFSVISMQVISTPQCRTSAKFEVSTHIFQLSAISVHTFRIIEAKLEGIVISSLGPTNAVLIDGPVHLSPTFSFSIDYSKVYTTTFQCLVQITTKNATSADNMSALRFNKYHQDSENISLRKGKVLFSLKNFRKYNKTNIQILHLRTQPHLYLNIEMLTYTFVGAADKNCLRGGLSFYDHDSGNFKEMFLSCNKSNSLDKGHFMQHFHIYSESSSACLILYQYPHYSELNIQFYISATQCRSVKINTCLYSLGFKGVTLLQTSSLLFEKQPFSQWSLDLLNKTCMMLQVSAQHYFGTSNYFKTNLISSNCGFSFEVRKTLQHLQHWKIQVSGLATNISWLRWPVFKISAYSQHSWKGSFSFWNQVKNVSNCFWNSVTGLAQCTLTLMQESASYDLWTVVETPSKMAFEAYLHLDHWSNGWFQIMIEALDSKPRTVSERALDVGIHSLLTPKSETVLLRMFFLTNHTCTVKFSSVSHPSVVLLGRTFKWHHLTWSHSESLVKMTGRDFLLVLPGIMKCLVMHLSACTAKVKLKFEWVVLDSLPVALSDQSHVVFHNKLLKNVDNENIAVETKRGIYVAGRKCFVRGDH